MDAQSTHTSVDPEEIRAAWHGMRDEYHQLVASISPAAFKNPTIDTQWTVGEILIHMIQTLEVMPRGIDSVRRSKDFLNLPLNFIGKANYLLVKRMARNATPQSLLARYDRAFNAAIHSWDSVQENEWKKGACLFGEGYKTLLEYYMHAPIHFNEHAAQIRNSLIGTGGQQ